MKKSKINLKSVATVYILLALILSSCASLQSSPMLSSDKVLTSNREIASDSTTDEIINTLKSQLSKNLSDERKEELQIIQENLVKYLIEASNSPDKYKLKVYKDATNYFNKMYPVLLSNIENELKGIPVESNIIKRAPLWTLKDELNYLNDDIKTLKKPKIIIDPMEGIRLIAPFYQQMSDYKKKQLAKQYKSSTKKFLGNELSLIPTFNEIDAILSVKGSEEDHTLKTFELIEKKMNVHTQSIRKIGTKIEQSGQIDTNSSELKMVVRFMDYYFNQLPEDTVKTILSELVTAGPKLTEETAMSIVFQNTGPGLGKLLQQIGKEKGIGEKFEKLMKVLESDGKEVPYHFVQAIAKADQGGYEFISIAPKALGTGTMAQVSEAHMWVDGIDTKVALRYLKPGIGERSKEDIQILRDFIPDNMDYFKAVGIKDIKVLETMVNGVEKFLNEEVDISLAVQKQVLANEIYSHTVKLDLGINDKFKLLEIKVPKIYLPPTGNSKLHIQEFASGGKKFADITDSFAQKEAAREIVRLWFEEALFKSGFLHADLHQGNFRVALIEEEGKIKIVIYDFGLSSTLTKEDQRAFILVAAGAHYRSPSMIADGLMASIDTTQVSDKNLRSTLIKNIQEELKVNPNKSTENWVTWCIQKNYFVSDKLGAFARGSMLIKQLPESIGETEMFKDTVVKSAISSLKTSIADRDYKFPLKIIDLIKIGTLQTKSYCIGLIEKFFK